MFWLLIKSFYRHWVDLLSCFCTIFWFQGNFTLETHNQKVGCRLYLHLWTLIFLLSISHYHHQVFLAIGFLESFTATVWLLLVRLHIFTSSVWLCWLFINSRQHSLSGNTFRAGHCHSLIFLLSFVFIFPESVGILSVMFSWTLLWTRGILIRSPLDWLQPFADGTKIFRKKYLLLSWTVFSAGVRSSVLWSCLRCQSSFLFVDKIRCCWNTVYNFWFYHFVFWPLYFHFEALVCCMWYGGLKTKWCR